MPKRNRDNLARRKPTRQPYPTFLIVCEGEVTECEYFIDLRHLARVSITLRFRSGGVPRTLVQIAAEEKKRPNDYDQIWVVCDVDEHPVKWTPLSRPFLARNKLMFDGSEFEFRATSASKPPVAIPALELALRSHPCGALSAVRVLPV